MKRTILILMAVLFLWVLPACTTSKKATCDTRADAQVTATTETERHTEATQAAAVVSTSETNEKKEVVIDFVTLTFAPGTAPTFPEDSTRTPGWLQEAMAAALASGDRYKPPNVTTATSGRVVINGDKKQTSQQTTTTEQTATEDTAKKEEVQADSHQQETAKTETEKASPGQKLLATAEALIILAALAWLLWKFIRKRIKK